MTDSAPKELYSTTLATLISSTGELQIPPGKACLRITYAGAVELLVELPIFTPLAQVPRGGTLQGVTLDGFSAEFKDAVIEHSSSSIGNGAPPKTTLSMTAIETTLRAPAHTSAHWDRKVFWLHGPHLFGSDRWSFPPYTCELTTLRGSHEHQVVPVKLTVEAALAADKSNFDDWRAATLALLSIASRTQCRVFLEHTFINNALVEVKAMPYPDRRHATHPLIAPFDLPTFMGKCTAPFLAQETPYDLHTLVGYYCRSHEEQIAEGKFIYAGVFMEALKFYWALNVGALPRDTKQSGLIRGFKQSNGAHYTFEALLKMTAAHLGLAHNYTFMDERNALFHTGRPASVQMGTGAVWPLLQPELSKLHDEMDDILLTLVKYTGKFRPYWDQQGTRTI